MRTRILRYDFRGVLQIPAAGSGDSGPFVKAITGAAPPTVQGVSGGGVALALTAASQVQNACLYMGDILPFDIDDLCKVSFLAKLSAGLDASVQTAFGVASARNDAIDSISHAALFRCIGNNNVVCETDDNTTDVDDAATGQTLVASYKQFVIDFASGVKTQSPPALSMGGKADVQFFMDNANGSLRRVARNTAFDMSAYAGNLQLFAQIQKTSGTATGTLELLEAEVEVKVAA